MQLVVVMAVRKAVSAATMTFTAISMKRFFCQKRQKIPPKVLFCRKKSLSLHSITNNYGYEETINPSDYDDISFGDMCRGNRWNQLRT